MAGDDDPRGMRDGGRGEVPAQPWRQSLRGRLTLLVTLVLAGPIAALGYFAYHHYRSLYEGYVDQAAAYAGYVAGADHGVGASVHQFLLAFAQDETVAARDSERCSVKARWMLAQLPRFANVGAVRPDGTGFCSALGVANDGTSFAEREWFREAVATPGLTGGQFWVGYYSGVPALIFALATRDEEGTVKAVVFASLDVARLSAALGADVHRDAAAYLIDRDGLVIARSHDWRDAVARRLEDPYLLAALRSGTPDLVIAEGMAGIERAWLIRPLSGAGKGRLHLAVGFDRAAPYREALGGVAPLLWLMLVSVVLAYGFAWWSSGLLVLRPFRRIIGTVSRFRDDDQTARCGPPYADNELGNLARSFDDLADTLAARRQALLQAEGDALRRAGELEALFEASPAAIVTLDAEGRVCWWNAAAATLFGHASVEMGGQPFPALREHPDIQEALRSGARQTVRAQLPNRLGQPVEVEVSAAPLSDGGALYLISDVGDRVQLERQYLQSQKMEAVGQLTGGIAHDFNNLLGVLIGNLDLVRERVEADAEGLVLVDAAIEAALRGADLNKRLLAFSRRQALSPEEVGVCATLGNMVRLLRRSLGERIQVRLCCSEADWMVRVDPVQLETAIVNLSLNARDAMPDGGVLTIEVKIAFLDAEYADTHHEVTPGEYVAIVVSDTGRGIPADVLGRVFDPFFTTKPVGQGTGLGLSMVYGFIKQSGGHVSIYSEVGRGTSVRIYLPRSSGGRNAVAEERAAAASVAANQELVLLVEDNADMRKVTMRQLVDLGYRVHEAENADQAVALLDGGLRPDILVSDVVMPGGMDGIDLAEHYEERFADAKVLLMSGFTERAMIEARGRHGGRLPFRLLPKPFRKADLETAMRVALGLEADRQGATVCDG